LFSLYKTQKHVSRRGSNKVESFFSQTNGLFEGNNIGHELGQAMLLFFCLRYQLLHRAARAGLPKPTDFFPWLAYRKTALRASLGLPNAADAPRPPRELTRKEKFGLSGFNTLSSWTDAGSEVSKLGRFMEIFHSVAGKTFEVDLVPSVLLTGVFALFLQLSLGNVGMNLCIELSSGRCNFPSREQPHSAIDLRATSLFGCGTRRSRPCAIVGGARKQLTRVHDVDACACMN
jgi:hypothetical protein